MKPIMPLMETAAAVINVSERQAIAIAKEYVKTVSWTANGQVVNNFTILSEPVEARLYPHPRKPLDMILYWYVTLQLDQVYPKTLITSLLDCGQTQEKSVDIN